MNVLPRTLYLYDIILLVDLVVNVFNDKLMFLEFLAIHIIYAILNNCYFLAHALLL